MKQLTLCFSMLLATLITLGQTKVEYFAELPTVEKTDFYRIKINPDITARTNRYLHDIRLIDSKGNETAYLLRKEAPIKQEKLFVNYEIIEKKHFEKQGYTRVVFRNPKKSELKSISLITKNADVSKWLTLNASDDMKRWYVLKDRYFFRSFYTESGTNEIKILNFPTSNYEFYELLVYDIFDRPINIESVGYYDTKIEDGIYSQIKNPNIFQVDSLDINKTFVKISFDEPYLIDKIAFEIEGNKFYYRQACIGKEDSIRYKTSYKKFINCTHSFFLNSSNLNQEYMNGSQKKDYWLTIENFNDQPLKITNVIAWQLTNYMIAELKKGEQYRLKFGDKTMAAPIYDIGYFADSIPHDITTINTGEITKKTTIEEKNPLVSVKSIWMWLILGVLIAVLAYFSFKMLREMKQTDSTLE